METPNMMKDRTEWIECKGSWPTNTGSVWLSSLFARHYPHGMVKPSFERVEDGLIRVTWFIGTSRVTLEVDTKTRRGRWIARGVESNMRGPTFMMLDEPECWHLIVHWIIGISAKHFAENRHWKDAVITNDPPPAPENVYRESGWFV
jgi:hypothetical protein